MSVARARVLQGLRSSFTRATPRVSAPARTQLAVGRRYASGGGHGHSEPTSDLPWALGGAIITVPACWYLWPSPSADHGHGHGHDDHAEHAEEHEEMNEPAEEEAAPAEEPKEEESTPENDSAVSSTEKTPKDQQEEGKSTDEPSASGEVSGSQGEGQDAGVVKPSENSEEKEDKEKSGRGKGMVKADSDAASETRKSEPDNKGGNKTRIDSGLRKELGTPEKFKDSTDESSASAASPGSGDMAEKQKGMSNTGARHSHAVHDDPEKSKKPEGPETAKVMGTVDPNRPAV